MALISNYGHLKAQIASWINRKSLNNELDTFIQLAEQRIGVDVQVPNMLTKGTGTASGGFLEIPDTLQELVYLKIGDRVLGREELLCAKDGVAGTGSPSTYSQATTETSQSGVQLFPAASGETYEYEGYFKYPPMTIASDTNWLLANHSMLHLSASLVAANLFVKDLEQAAVWETAYNNKKDELMKLNDRSRYPGGSLEITYS